MAAVIASRRSEPRSGVPAAVMASGIAGRDRPVNRDKVIP